MKLSSKLLISTTIGAIAVLVILKQKNNQAELTPATEETTRLETTQAPVSPTNHADTAKIKQTSNSTIAKPTTQTSVKTEDDAPLYPQGPLSVQEVESVNNMVKTISQAIAKRSNSNQFMKAVQALHLKPKFIDEGSNAVGSMVTVRTHDALDGTRYLHAQFTGEKNNADYLQHVSFQIRPGSNSFQTAVEILNQFLPKNKVIKESASDYVRYNTDDGYVAWAKIATRDDLKSNKYNASSKEDVGSVIVTIEQEIHDMDEDGHSH